MAMKKILIALTVLLPFAAHAQDAREKSATTIAANVVPGTSCTMTETANVNVSFNSIEKDAETAAAVFDVKSRDIQNAAKDVKLEKFDVQSMNYSLYPYNTGAMGAAVQWQLSGNISFTVVPANKGKDVLALLVKKGFQPSLNVSSYKSGNCTN
jgi:uncharacterized protein YggE